MDSTRGMSPARCGSLKSDIRSGYGTAWARAHGRLTLPRDSRSFDSISLGGSAQSSYAPQRRWLCPPSPEALLGLPGFPPDCLGQFHNTRDVNHLHIQELCSPPISSAVLNRLSRALRGHDRMAIACAPVLPAPSAAFRAAIAGAPEAPVGRDPGGFGPFRGRGRPRGSSWRPSEPTSRRWVTHRTPGSSAELPSTFSFGGAENRGSTAAQPTRPDPPATRGRPRA